MNQKPPVIEESVATSILKPSRPAQLVSPKNLKYHVVTKETSTSKLDENPALICLNWDDYLSVSKFNQDVLQYIREGNLIIDYYEGVIDDLGE